MSHARREPPDQEHDVIVQEIKTAPQEQWGVFVRTQLQSQHDTRIAAELAAEELADRRGVRAWVCDFGKYAQLD